MIHLFWGCCAWAKISVGYTGTGEMDNCENIDECSVMNGESTARHNCESNAMCTDSDGSFDCECLPGYNGDGVNCTGMESPCLPSCLLLKRLISIYCVS